MSTNITKKNGILAWHFLPDNGLTNNGENIKVIAGQTLKLDPPVILCQHGYHWSINPMDALDNAPGSIICRVLAWGDIQQDDNKGVSSNRTCLWIADANRTLHEFALWNAERAFEWGKVENPDPRSLKALEVKRLWLDGKATDEELSRASEAASRASRAASEAASEAASRATSWAASRAASRATSWATSEATSEATSWAASWAASRATSWASRASEAASRAASRASEAASRASEAASRASRAASRASEAASRASRATQNSVLESMLFALEGK